LRPVGTDDFDSNEAATVRSSASRRFVLPRVLRRPARALRRAEWRLPRHAGLKGLALLFLATGLAAVVAGGHGTTVVSTVTAFTGFGIENIRITGQTETSEVDVLAGLELGPFPSLLTLDVEIARERVEALPWVKRAVLTKLFPDTLEIAIIEREPYALWQHDGVVSLVDGQGRVISDRFSERYASLPRVVGEGAAGRIGEYLALIEPFPEIARRARAGILVSDDRWTVVLDSGMQLMLPAANPAGAVATVAALDREQAILSREIAALDLRAPGELIVRLTDEGLAARQVLLKEREQIAHRGRTKT
jgi:cell division protein FtsQ